MKTHATRSALVALTVVGAGALSASPALASIPTFYVNQPQVTAAKHVTPESATIYGKVDTGGSPGTTFSLAPGASQLWADSFYIINTGSSAQTEHVDGLPASGSNAAVPTSSGSFSNSGADNYAQVVMEYDTWKDFVASGNNPGPNTLFAPEVNVPTAAGLSSVSARIGALPAAAGQFSGTTPLKPGTKYVYFITMQPGATTAAQSYNTYNGTTVTTNPTYSCMPTAYAAVTAPYSGYTSTGTLTGGTPTSSTQPEIQGPCIYLFGGSANYYNSNYRTFTTPKLGTVSFSKKAIASGGKASLKATDKSVVAAKGTLILEIRKGHKMVSAAHGSVSVRAHKTKTITVTLTKAGKAALAKSSSGVRTNVVFKSKMDQPTSTHHITIK